MWQPTARMLTLERDGGRCVVCGRSDNLSVHHLKPRAIGGATHPANLVTLCRDCHDLVEGSIRSLCDRLAASLLWFCYTPLLQRENPMSDLNLASTPSTPAEIRVCVNNIEITVDAEGLYIDGRTFELGAVSLDVDDSLAVLAALNRPAVKRLLMRAWNARQHQEFLERQEAEAVAAD